MTLKEFSLRDVVNKVPETKKDLEQYLMDSYPHIREEIEKDPRKRKILREITNNEFDRYARFLVDKNLIDQGISTGASAAGYAGDVSFFTGNFPGWIGFKALSLISRGREKVGALEYASQTGNYRDSLQTIVEWIGSVAPGFTWLDQGLNRIIRKRMVKNALYKAEEEFGLPHKSWSQKVYERIKGAYSNVKNRKENVVSPRGELQAQPVKD